MPVVVNKIVVKGDVFHQFIESVMACYSPYSSNVPVAWKPVLMYTFYVVGISILTLCSLKIPKLHGNLEIGA